MRGKKGGDEKSPRKLLSQSSGAFFTVQLSGDSSDFRSAFLLVVEDQSVGIINRISRLFGDKQSRKFLLSSGRVGY